QAITFARRPYDEELRRGGHLVARGYLTTRRGATELCTRNGSLLTNERPAGPTDGDLESIALIEARDLNEAIRVASNHPAAHMGAELGWRVEVWPFER